MEYCSFCSFCLEKKTIYIVLCFTKNNFFLYNNYVGTNVTFGMSFLLQPPKRFESVRLRNLFFLSCVQQHLTLTSVKYYWPHRYVWQVWQPPKSICQFCFNYFWFLSRDISFSHFPKLEMQVSSTNDEQKIKINRKIINKIIRKKHIHQLSRIKRRRMTRFLQTKKKHAKQKILHKNIINST